MEWSSVVSMALAGTAAGAINAIAGGGSLVTFPTLLALGYPPVVANVTNTVAALPGYIGGAWGYRRELSGLRRRIFTLSAVTVLGALLGSALLLLGNERTFTAVVPWLVLASTLLLAVQPYLTRLMERGNDRGTEPAPRQKPLRWAGLGQFGVAVYGGYFNAGLGIMMLGVLGLVLHEPLQRLNALKSVLSVVASTVSLVYFAIFATVSWPAAAVMAVTGLLGGWFGAAIGRRLPVPLLRWSVVTFGLIVFLVLMENHAS
ncbi:hypothetical protein SAMN04489751_1058 [Brevibacterium sandarakinum]|uniref:Probable membrane transporter protein n=2 Tax=Brevibacterium sandarakinum TaxID=629680 RepID=A0A1H1NV77_BRESA|nr:hypothetical protein SAMN04489751_1058 [Brevibacterium sandarakinum]